MNVTFPCEVTGYPQPTITWYKNAKEISNNKKTIRKGNSLTVVSTWGKDEGIYQCIASNGLETVHEAVSLIVGGWYELLCLQLSIYVLLTFINNS